MSFQISLGILENRQYKAAKFQRANEIFVKAGVVQDTEQLRNESIACLRAKAQQHQLQLSLQPATGTPETTSYSLGSQTGTLHASV